MNNTRGDYRNPRHDEIVGAIRNGLSDSAVAKLLGVCRNSVGRIRRAEGIPAFTNARTLAQVIMQDARTDDDGHTHWDGVRDIHGIPQVRLDGRYVPVSHVAFEMRYGHKPSGYVKADCGVKHCLTPDHMLDDRGRRTLYLQLRALHGLGGHWTVCRRCGGDWESVGRIQSDLKLYCNHCKSNRKKAAA